MEACQPIPTCCAVLSHVAGIDALGEQRRVVVHVLEVHLHVGVTHQTLPTLVLGEHCEPPLRSAMRLVSVQRL